MKGFDNPTIGLHNFSMWINRTIEKLVTEYLNYFPALLLTGPRQTGKTSLYQYLFSEYNYVSLDDPFEAERAENTPQAFLASYPTPLVIDEVQYAPALFRYLKLVIDEQRRTGSQSTEEPVCQYLLTGSQNFELMSNVSESRTSPSKLWSRTMPLNASTSGTEAPPALKTDMTRSSSNARC